MPPEPGPEEPQPGRIERADGLLEPGHAERGDLLGKAQRLLRGQRAVGVDVELGIADRRARRPHAVEVGAGSRPTFIFTRGIPAATHPPSCSASSRGV